MAKKDEIYEGPNGGALFFLSLIGLAFFSLFNAALLIQLPATPQRMPWWRFTLAAALGVALAQIVIRGRLATFIHEFKHALLSGLVGNRARKIHIEGSGGGHFEYEFTKQTARYNATIALAPYWLPLFTVFFLALAHVWWHNSASVLSAIAGVAYGADCYCNVRDLSPRQSDLRNIRGGPFVAGLYILFANLLFFTFLVAWVIGGWGGVADFFSAYWEFVLRLSSRLS